MRLERIAANKIKVFLTFDDLQERGLTKEDLWLDRPRVHQLFRDLVMEADTSLGFKADGTLSVEVFALPAQGMVIHISKNETENEEDDMIEMDITVDERLDLFYKFQDFEAVLQLVAIFTRLGVKSGKLMSMDGYYYLHFPARIRYDLGYDRCVALISEFGEACPHSPVVVEEHGSILIKKQAVTKLASAFSLRKEAENVEKEADF
ncbi:adapter protein MecA 1/2 [Geomicrobium halophilum]|uniref:Adapter protein MecA 1/2 n=1 Tax=Geomicrobium halophilum TaxID=549000 RepID=A0A841Q0L6_9BACL|nr:adaptor protein MecA [Geomicrobium halophilum]MBB6449008.1 adapter protein MecA 1/2 [Geomicrobium halophilum]